MKNAFALLSGTIFGLGLSVSGMTNPDKVLSFLDISGQWDPTLAFVMCGALIISIIGTHISKRRGISLIGEPLQLPTRRDIDAGLVTGAGLFGLGWGLVGLCPGPALAGIYRGDKSIFVFVISMILGIVIHRLLTSPGNNTASPPKL